MAANFKDGFSYEDDSKKSLEELLRELLAAMGKSSKFAKDNVEQQNLNFIDQMKHFSRSEERRKQDLKFMTDAEKERVKRVDKQIKQNMELLESFDRVLNSFKNNTKAFGDFIKNDALSKENMKGYRKMNAQFGDEQRKMKDRQFGGNLIDHYMKKSPFFQMLTKNYVGAPGSRAKQNDYEFKALQENQMTQLSDKRIVNMLNANDPGSGDEWLALKQKNQKDTLAVDTVGNRARRRGRKGKSPRGPSGRTPIVTPYEGASTESNQSLLSDVSTSNDTKLLTSDNTVEAAWSEGGTSTTTPNASTPTAEAKETALEKKKPTEIQLARRRGKYSPTKADVAALPAAYSSGFLLISDQLDKFFKDSKKSGMGGAGGAGIGEIFKNALKGLGSVIGPALMSVLPTILSVLIPLLPALLIGGGLYALFKKMFEEPAPGSAPLTEKEKDAYDKVKNDPVFKATHPKLNVRPYGMSDSEIREAASVAINEQVVVDQNNKTEWTNQWLKNNPGKNWVDAERAYDALPPKKHSGGAITKTGPTTILGPHFQNTDIDLNKGDIVDSPVESVNSTKNIQKLVSSIAKNSEYTTHSSNNAKLEELFTNSIAKYDAMLAELKKNNDLTIKGNDLISNIDKPCSLPSAPKQEVIQAV
jgi:hypothetical protein